MVKPAETRVCAVPRQAGKEPVGSICWLFVPTPWGHPAAGLAGSCLAARPSQGLHALRTWQAHGVRPRQPPAPPSPRRLWASSRHPVGGSPTPPARQPLTQGGQLPFQLTRCRLPALGHRVGPPRCPAASRCHRPLPQGQLPCAFDSPVCRCSRPTGGLRPSFRSLLFGLGHLPRACSQSGQPPPAPLGQSSQVPDVTEGGAFGKNRGTCFTPALALTPSGP